MTVPSRRRLTVTGRAAGLVAVAASAAIALSLTGVALVTRAGATSTLHNASAGTEIAGAFAGASAPVLPDVSGMPGQISALRSRPWAHRCHADSALAAALAPLERQATGRFAVAVADRDTGVAASFHGREPFHTASIVKALVLAALLLQQQQGHLAPGYSDGVLAAEMIEDSDNDAATDLWDAVGGSSGMAAAVSELGLHRTVPGPSDWWGLTSTTAGDQVRLLADLTSPSSPLGPASRADELRLMRQIEPGQDWGVTAAADRTSDPAVKDGWLPDASDDGLWVINSVGVIRHDGHELLMAVLSAGQPSEGEGIFQVESVARAAASAITRAGSQSCT
jgi:hypothetical protein